MLLRCVEGMDSGRRLVGSGGRGKTGVDMAEYSVGSLVVVVGEGFIWGGASRWYLI